MNLNVKEIMDKLDKGHIYTWMDSIDISDEGINMSQVDREIINDAHIRISAVKFVPSDYEMTDKDSGIVITIAPEVVSKSNNQQFQKITEGKNLIPIAHANGILFRYGPGFYSSRPHFAIVSHSVVLLDTNLNAEGSIFDNLYVINYPLTSCVLSGYNKTNHENSKKLVEIRNKCDDYIEKFDIDSILSDGHHVRYTDYKEYYFKKDPDFCKLAHSVRGALKKYAQDAKSHNASPLEIDILRRLNAIGKEWGYKYTKSYINKFYSDKEITKTVYTKISSKLDKNYATMNLGEFLDKADDLIEALNAQKARREKIENIKNPIKASVSDIRQTLRIHKEEKQLKRELDEFSR